MKLLKKLWSSCPPGLHAARSRKFSKDFARELGFKGITFRIKIRDFQKIEKKKIFLSICIFDYETRKNIQPMFQKILSKDLPIYYR